MVAENKKNETNPANRSWQRVALSIGIVARSCDLQPLAFLEGIMMAMGALFGISFRRKAEPIQEMLAAGWCHIAAKLTS